MADRATLLRTMLKSPKRAADAMPPAPALAAPHWGWALLALAVALIAQTTLLHAVQFRGGTLSLALLVVLWFAASAGTVPGIAFGVVAGALEDALSGATGAAWTFATPLAAALAARSVRGTGWNHPLFLGVVVGVAALVRFVTFWMIMRAEHRMPALPTSAVHAALWSALFDAVAAAAAATVFREVRPRVVERH